MKSTKRGARGCTMHTVGPAERSATAAEAAAIASAVTIDRSLPARSVASVAADTLPPLSRFGHYRILERVGAGALTAVYKAYDPDSDRLLAIKLLHAEPIRDEASRARFLREGALSLSHPNIVAVLGSGAIDGRPYIAMEWLDGRPLSELLVEGRGRALDDVLDIGTQLAGALDCVHGSGIVHGDIKPGNLIRVGGSGMVKLADFSIAHRPAGETEASTQCGAIAGTPYYMSPEQVLGGTIDARSDLWAAGVILYQLATGRRPFEASTIVTLRYRIANDSPPPLAAMREDIPPGLCRIIERCLKKRPDERFQSARELADALAGVLR